MSTHRVMELLWGLEVILLCGVIYTTVKMRNMNRTVRSMQSQIDELTATHVLMQDHLDRIGPKWDEGSRESGSNATPPGAPQVNEGTYQEGDGRVFLD